MFSIIVPAIWLICWYFAVRAVMLIDPRGDWKKHDVLMSLLGLIIAPIFLIIVLSDNDVSLREVFFLGAPEDGPERNFNKIKPFFGVKE